jgi:glucose/arabinose dehydrogenase
MISTRNVANTALFSAVFTVILLTGSVRAQEDSLPILRLDRIPASPAFLGQTRAAAARPSEYKVQTVLSGLSFPWALSFLPDGDIILTERRNGLRILDASGKLSEPLGGMPVVSEHPKYPSFGWFDVALDPDFSTNRWVYFSYYAVAGDDPEAPGIARVGRARLSKDNMSLEDFEVIVDGKGTQEIHFASDGTLMVAGAGNFSADPQDLNLANGKLLRVNSDGSIPFDNPYRSSQEAHPEIYSVGHRDISGIGTHPVTGEVWATEHGPRGGDELNIIRRGGNYGWKVISYGTEYSGDPIGDGSGVRDGLLQPVYFWRPSIAPSALLFYTGEMFPEWRGSAFVGSLSGQHLSRLVIEGDRVIAEERLLVDRANRIRAVEQGPDGALYILTNEERDTPRGTAELLKISRP